MTKSQNNPFFNEEFESREPVEQRGNKVRPGDIALDEELTEGLEGEMEDIDEELKETAENSKSPQELKDEVRGLREELQLSKEKLLRAHAEIENIRKRGEVEVEKAYKYSNEKFMKELLPVVDSLEKALEANTGEASSVYEGIQLTYKMLQDTLEKHGVRVINPLHQLFDPHLHEAVSMRPGDQHKSNTILQVLQKGYELNGRLIRPAMVIVAQ